jgi:sporulation protein YlmC with PRC-barrel domain
MHMKIFESELRGKTVMSDEGAYLGILRNTTVQEATGELASILIEPSDEIDPRLYHQDPSGHLVFPFASVRSVRDVIIITTT